MKSRGMFAAGAAIGVMLAMTAPGFAQEGVGLEKVRFEKEDRTATQIARRMYQPEFQYVSAERIWLRDPVEGATDQLAVKIGFGPSCERDCSVAVLYHTGGEWAEVWRGPGKEIELGEVDEVTGLKSIFSKNREWQWGGAKYEPNLYGGYPTRRPATETEMRLAVEWLNANQPDVAGTSDAPTIDALDVNLMNGDETLIFMQGIAVCGNDECPLLVTDAGKVIQQFYAIGPDAGVGDGRTDANGFRALEIQTSQDVSVVSATTGETLEHILPMDVIPAGTPRVIAEAPPSTQLPELR
ncbi:hypothetical protein [Aureimonas sp. SK2]|uniref:hypothetical protein n=1 Tax=Aureimonas sp. SK2 TaxID=3015992 RepID=UPI0024441E8D|nr:hypothetical protein [Aureimonas sp. SK2]